MSATFSDHRFLFSLALIAPYLAPYLVALLGIPSSFSYPTPWMLGLLCVALGAYCIGTLLHHCAHLIPIRHRATRRGVVGTLFVLLCLLFSHYGLPLPLGIAGAAATILVLHYALTPRFTVRHSVLLVLSALSMLGSSFVVLGGIPVLNWDGLRRSAVLSPVREVALPLFLLGATYLALKARTLRSRMGRHAVPLILFAGGFLIFLSNGKRIDAATMVIVYLIYALRTYSHKVTLPAIALASGLGVSAAYLHPSILGLFRQRFNFQLLGHIIAYVQHPLSGATHGAITLGINQHFLGPHLLYGEGQDWSLTATWLGPAYFDFGLPGVLLTMIGLAVIMQFLLRHARAHPENDKFETIYVVSLAFLISLFEEGLDLFGVIFLFAMLYTVLSASGANAPRSKADAPTSTALSGVNAKKTIILVGLISLGLLTLAWSFNAEFHAYTTVYQTSIDQGTTILTPALGRRYYQIEVFGGEWAVGWLRGELIITRPGTTTHQLEIDHLFWLAKRDLAEVGWFRPEDAGNYTFTLFLEEVPIAPHDHTSLTTTLKLKELPLSEVVPNSVVLGVGEVLVLASLLYSSLQCFRVQFSQTGLNGRKKPRS